MIRDRADRRRAHLRPRARARSTTACSSASRQRVVLVDGTFWRDDELVRLGIADATRARMGHVPLSGPGGTLEALAGLERPRKVLVHINNTNPILLEDSPERAAVVRAGVEVAYDGMEVEL